MKTEQNALATKLAARKKGTTCRNTGTLFSEMDPGSLWWIDGKIKGWESARGDDVRTRRDDCGLCDAQRGEEMETVTRRNKKPLEKGEQMRKFLLDNELLRASADRRVGSERWEHRESGLPWENCAAMVIEAAGETFK